MSLVYRAMWQDDRKDLCDVAFAEFKDWVESKYSEQLSIPTSGRTDALVDRNGKCISLDVSVERASNGNEGTLDTLRAVLTEDDEDEVRRQTTLRVWRQARESIDRASDGWIWIDNSVVGEAIDLKTYSPAAPKLTRNLLEKSPNARIDGFPIMPKAQYYQGSAKGEELAHIVSEFDRKLPIVVFAADNTRFEAFGGQGYTFDSIVERASAHVAGIAHIAVVDKAAATAFNLALGDSHGVWDGAFRVYVKGVDPATENDAWRHRYVTADRYMGYRSSAANILGRMLSSMSAVRRPPPSFSRAKALLDESRGDGKNVAELYEILSEDYEKAREEVISLRREVDELREQDMGRIIQMEDLLDEQDRVRSLAEGIQRRLDHAIHTLIHDGVGDAFMEDDTTGEFIPRKVTSAAEAVHQAHLYLSDHLTIHPRALRDAQDMDADNAGSTWAHSAWNAFRALHAYASSLSSGKKKYDFEYWCQSSNHPLTWPTNRLSMHESNKLKSDQSLWKHRYLPVSVEFDPSGCRYMEAHIKIVSTGGPMIPRIYFDVDYGKCKVHIGYFGPHKHMPNTRTN
ncbi:hypothetical protein QYS60_21295 [Rhodococcus sp. GXMU-t2271]|uniref:hypothetical protein n=1 Tax=Rhodococcus sp. GXMU-t2271 TaxID=3059079 RepID=UPI00352AA538